VPDEVSYASDKFQSGHVATVLLAFVGIWFVVSLVAFLLFIFKVPPNTSSKGYAPGD